MTYRGWQSGMKCPHWCPFSRRKYDSSSKEPPKMKTKQNMMCPLNEEDVYMM